MAGSSQLGLLASLGLIASVCCAVHGQSHGQDPDPDPDARDGPVNPLEGVALIVSWDGSQGEGKRDTDFVYFITALAFESEFPLAGREG